MKWILLIGGALLAGASVGISVQSLNDSIYKGQGGWLMVTCGALIFTLFFAYPAFHDIGLSNAIKKKKIAAVSDEEAATIKEAEGILVKYSAEYKITSKLFVPWMVAWGILCFIGALIAFYFTQKYLG